VICLLLMGWFTRGFVGISPAEMPRRQPDGIALAQIAAGASTAWLALSTRRPVRRTGVALYPGTETAADTAPRGTVRLSANRPASAAIVHRPVMDRIRTGVRGWRKRPKKEEVRFVGAEEHRCPYCLQPIVDKDPRGVVTCPVCHTRHHKDCWEVTGMCQIPHYHDRA
jgi:ribosomal protein L37AE/L43A